MSTDVRQMIEEKLDELAKTVIDGEVNYSEIWIIIQTHSDDITLEGIHSALCKELQRRTEVT